MIIRSIWDTTGEIEKFKPGRLGYNDENERYGLLVGDLWEVEGFNCGYVLYVLVGEEWIEDRIEMDIDQEWYLVETKLKGSNLEGLEVRIKV